MKSKNYLSIGGQEYYVNFSAIEKLTLIKNDTKIVDKESHATFDENSKPLGTELLITERDRTVEINGAKFEIVRALLEVLIGYNDESSDTSLGYQRYFDDLPFNVKLAINTLTKYGILQLI